MCIVVLPSYMSVNSVCALCPQKPKQGVKSSGKVTDSCEFPCGCWEPNPVLWESSRALNHRAVSLVSVLFSFHYIFYCTWKGLGGHMYTLQHTCGGSQCSPSMWVPMDLAQVFRSGSSAMPHPTPPQAITLTPGCECAVCDIIFLSMLYITVCSTSFHHPSRNVSPLTWYLPIPAQPWPLVSSAPRFRESDSFAELMFVELMFVQLIYMMFRQTSQSFSALPAPELSSFYSSVPVPEADVLILWALDLGLSLRLAIVRHWCVKDLLALG